MSRKPLLTLNKGGEVPLFPFPPGAAFTGACCSAAFVMLADRISALSNANRLQILEWLKHPARYFGSTHPVDQSEGVCGLYNSGAAGQIGRASSRARVGR